MGGVRGPRRAVFLDRDGTLNERPPPHEYVTSVEGFRWLPGAVDGLVGLARAGYVLTVVSNQRGVARGLVAPTALREIEDVIRTRLGTSAEIEAFRYCTHDVDDACGCRKPAPGMITGLARELELDLGESWMIGDTEADVMAGRAAGCRTALVGGAGPVAADVVAGTLVEASESIVRATRSAVA